jgi:hypothetical protein
MLFRVSAQNNSCLIPSEGRNKNRCQCFFLLHKVVNICIHDNLWSLRDSRIQLHKTWPEQLNRQLPQTVIVNHHHRFTHRLSCQAFSITQVYPNSTPPVSAFTKSLQRSVYSNTAHTPTGRRHLILNRSFNISQSDVNGFPRSDQSLPDGFNPM